MTTGQRLIYQGRRLLAPYVILWRHRELAIALTKQQIRDRYSGAFFGLLWIILQPLLFLGAFIFVFTVVFSRRWPTEGSEEIGNTGFALLVFVGLIVFWLISDCINRAPNLLRANAYYVKDILFPIELLAWINLGEALFHAAIRILLFIIMVALFEGRLAWTIIFLPLVWLPLILITLGVSWIFARIGTFSRDLDHIVGMLMTLALFLSAVFYSVNSIPLLYRNFFLANPIAFTIEQSRQVLVWGALPDWNSLGVFTLIGFLFVWLGWRFFTQARGIFADAL